MRATVASNGFESEQVTGIDHDARVVIQMNDEQFLTLARQQAFLDVTLAMDFSVLPAGRYSIIARTCHRFGNPRLKRAQQAVLLRFLKRVSGYWRQPFTRVVKRGVGSCALPSSSSTCR